MKHIIKKTLNIMAATAMMSGMMLGMAACGDDDLSKSMPDYDPRYQGAVDLSEADYAVEADATTLHVTFKSDMDWTALMVDENGDACSWATVTPDKGECTTPGYPGVKGKEAQDFTVDIALAANEDTEHARLCKLVISTEKGTSAALTIGQNYKVVMLDPASIPDYHKYICPESYNPHFENGPEYLLRQDSYYSWHRMKQSEHFFVFWSPEFGSDPNDESVAPAMRVDIDDLLQKAESFFDMNVNQLKLAELGQGKSMLDNYKMQIYLIYQDEWLATGSGYDDKIGALWINPSTCQPVGSTIAHEIGHSFQYQTYADRVNCQGAANDHQSGFRYGFVGPDGSGNGGCAYWEQCAQWQAQRSYPREQFESYNFNVWLNNCHRHFHHEWQRYASYWLQSYWVEKRGVEAYGHIWTQSVAPEDAIMAYTRIYNGDDYSKTREELFDYAVRMATYDIDGMREYANGYQGRYNATFVRNKEAGTYQITYGNCPGATGFNVIQLDVPANGGQISVDFTGLEYGAPLYKKDKGTIVDGDGNMAGQATNYNAVGGAENMGWRYGFVALQGDKRTYSEVGKAKNGTLSFNVPAGTELLYLVVQGSPEVYMSHGWDEIEANDPQFPYMIKLNNTDLSLFEEEVAPDFTQQGDELLGDLVLSVPTTNGDWVFKDLDLRYDAVLNFFGLSDQEFTDALVQPINGTPQEVQDGMIVVFNEESDGSLSNIPTANVGYWLNADGNAVNWGENQIVYYEIESPIIHLGKLGECGEPGQSVQMRPVFIYKDASGKEKRFKLTVTYNFK